MHKYNVTASIVLYKPQQNVFNAIKSFLNVPSLKIFLFLIDNSPANDFEKANEILISDKRIKYIFAGKNLGYGAAHNIALKKILNDSEYHLILNPDVYFEPVVINDLYNYAKCNPDVGHIMPKVIYPDGKLQYTCKLVPAPFNLISRLIPGDFFNAYNQKFELHNSGYNKIFQAPYLSGSFMFLRCNALKEIGLFDERFFMYPEDIDLTRRMHKRYKTIFYPYVEIIHEHTKSSFKSVRMFIIHAQNMIKYFNKWGWFF